LRDVLNQDQFTPFGLWIRQYLRDSTQGLSVTNLDYVIEDFHHKRIMLLEEKQSGGKLHRAQMLTFQVLDRCLEVMAERVSPKYDYWGFFVLMFPNKANMPGPGMTLNGKVITTEQLQKHLNFETKFCEPFIFPKIERVMN
jgi:hypothetical protein